MADQGLTDPNQTSVPAADLDRAVAEGTRTFSGGKRVNMVRPDGGVVSLPPDQVKDAISAGYKIEPAASAAVREYAEDQGIKGTMKVLVGQFADEALLGVPETAYDLTADPMERAKKEALKKRNEVANTIGGLAGFGASLFYGGPLWKGIGKGGKIAGEAVKKVLVEKATQAGLKGGAKEAIANIAIKTAEKAAQMGTEGALVSMPKAVTEAALGDPEAAGETLMWGAGLGTALGVAAGPASKAIGASVNTLKKLAGVKAKINTNAVLTAEEQKIADLARRDMAADSVLGGEQDLAKAAYAEGADEHILKSFDQLRSKKKSNWNEIREAYESLGLTPSEGALSSNPQVIQMEATLADSRSLVAQKYTAPIREALDTASTGLERGLGAGSNKSVPEVGAEIKALLSKKVAEQKDATSAIFRRFGEQATEIPVDTRLVAERIEPLLAEKDIQLAMKAKIKSPAADLAQKAMTLAKSASTLGDLDAAKRLLRGDVNFAMMSGNERRILTKATAALDDAYEEALGQAVKARAAKVSAVDRGEIEGLMADRKLANESYGALMEDAEELGGKLGRKIRSPGAFLDFLGEVPAEKLVEKLFTKKDSAFLQQFRRMHPEAFDKIIQAQRQIILDKATSASGQRNWGLVMREVRKLNPEVQDMLLRDSGLFRRASTVWDTLPKPFQSNPSRTDIRKEFREMLSPMRAVADVAGIAGHKFASRVDGILAVEQAQKLAAQKIDSIEGAVEKFLKTDRPVAAPAIHVLREMFPDAKNKQEAFDQLMDQLNDAKLYGPGAKHNVETPTWMVAKAVSDGGAGSVAQQYQIKMAQAVQYLASTMPQPYSPEGPLSNRKWKPTPYEMQEVEKRLATILDPFRVINDLENNSLSRAQTETLGAVYPQLYMKMRTSVLQALMKQKSSGKLKSVSYQKRMKISLLMGMDLDPSLSNISDSQRIFLPGATAQMEQAQQEDQGLKPVPQMENAHLALRMEKDELGDDA